MSNVELINKCVRILESCETKEQCQVAFNYCKQACTVNFREYPAFYFALMGYTLAITNKFGIKKTLFYVSDNTKN